MVVRCALHNTTHVNQFCFIVVFYIAHCVTMSQCTAMLLPPLLLLLLLKIIHIIFLAWLVKCFTDFAVLQRAPSLYPCINYNIIGLFDVMSCYFVCRCCCCLYKFKLIFVSNLPIINHRLAIYSTTNTIFVFAKIWQCS